MGVVVGSVAVPASTGNFSVSGLAFQPVAVVFFNQAVGLGPHSMFLGCATSSTEQWAVWMGTDTEPSVYNDRFREARTDRCCLQYRDGSTTATIAWAASLVSLDASGFTLNLTERTFVATGESGSIYYMALGGSNISDAYAGVVTAGASTGTVAVTAPGFQPTAAIFAHHSGAFDAGVLGFANFGTGVTDGVSQYSSYVRIEQGQPTLMREIHRTDAISCFWDGTNRWRIELDSFDTNGFTLNVAEAYVDRPQAYLAIKADGAVAGNGVQPDSDTTLTYDTPGLVPEGVFFCWAGADIPTTNGSSGSPLRPGMGAGTISQERFSSGIARSSAPFGVWTSDGYQQNTEPLGFWGVGSGVGGSDNQPQASANISSLDPGSFDLTWTNVLDTNNRAFGWLALPGDLVGVWIPQSYRRN